MNTKAFHINNGEYNQLYGSIPDTQEEILKYLESNLLDSELVNVNKETTRLESSKWNIRDYTFYLVPKGTPRPRSSGGHFYVKGARQMKKFFETCLSDEGVICTSCHYSLTVYLPTPIGSMSNEEIYLAENGLIRPMVTPDFDNLAKTYTDCLQDVILLNDNIIVSASIEKFYSLKPRINIILQWQDTFDSKYNETKTKNSMSYRKLIESGE